MRRLHGAPLCFPKLEKITLAKEEGEVAVLTIASKFRERTSLEPNPVSWSTCNIAIHSIEEANLS